MAAPQRPAPESAAVLRVPALLGRPAGTGRDLDSLVIVPEHDVDRAAESVDAVPDRPFVQDLDALDRGDGERAQIQSRHVAPIDKIVRGAGPESRPTQAEAVVDRPASEQFRDARQARHLDVRPVDHGHGAHRVRFLGQRRGRGRCCHEPKEGKTQDHRRGARFRGRFARRRDERGCIHSDALPRCRRPNIVHGGRTVG